MVDLAGNGYARERFITGIWLGILIGFFVACAAIYGASVLVDFDLSSAIAGDP